jgi:ABC-2 type transport system permease protein
VSVSSPAAQAHPATGWARPGRLGPELAIARRAFADGRVRTLAFFYVFAAIAYIQPVTYRSAYPSVADREGFASSFGDNKAVRLFYGEPHDLLTTSGYTAWRVGGTLAIFAALWGLLAAVRAFRAEEEAGRTELLLAGIVARRGAYLAGLAAVAGGGLALFLAILVGLVVAGLPVGGSAYLGVAVTSVLAVFVGVGALTSQLAATRRMATELGVGAFAVCFVVRVIADTATGLGWLRWATPLGWAEELRPLTGARPAVVVLPLAATAVLLVVALRIAERRDVGSGLLAGRETGPPRLGLLSSPTAQAVRLGRGSLIAWLSGVGAFAFIIGLLANSISSAGVSKSLQQQFAKLGSGSILTPTGYLGFTFIFFILAVSLFAVAQISAAREEEASQRLETLLALPAARRRWLGGRLGVATAGAGGIALASGVFAWLGAAAVGVKVSFGLMLEAGANCLPVALLFLGIAAVAFALAPRASTGISYGIVGLAFLWDLFGALLGAPGWVLKLSPFEDVGLVPGAPLKVGAAIVMLGLAVSCMIAAGELFRRRDLSGA